MKTVAFIALLGAAFIVMGVEPDANSKPSELDFKIPDKIGSVFVNKQPGMIAVQITIGGGIDHQQKPAAPLPAPKVKLQAWLLLADGTSLVQKSQSPPISVGNAGYSTTFVTFTFMAQPTDEPVGLVLSVDGDLHTKELQKPLAVAALVGRRPIINFDTALGIAKNYVDEHHIDISDKFLQSMTLERRPDRPDKFWRASWELALPDSQPHKGGQLFIDVAMDKSVTIGLGE